MARSISKNRIVRTVFTKLAPVFDRLDPVLTGKRGASWRRLAASLPLPHPPRRILDACTGTGLLAAELAQAHPRSHVVGVDFCPAMASLARQRVRALALGRQVEVKVENVEIMPFAEEFFDAAFMAFGLRFVSDIRVVIKELWRVLHPGGPAAILELARPRGCFGRLRAHWRREIYLPWWGRLGLGLPRRLVYPLHDALAHYPDPDKLAFMLERAGFRDVGYVSLGGGLATLHRGRKPMAAK